MVGTMLAAQAVDGNSSLGNIGLVFEFGFWAGAVIPIGLGVCLIVTGIAYAKKLNKMSMFTLPDFYFRRYGNGAEGISGILMIISFTILVAGNLAASGIILELVFGIDYIWGIAISAIVVVAYTIAGGLFASAWTNLFQVYLAIGAFWAAFIFFAGGFSGVEWATIYNNAPPEFMDITGLTDIANGALINWAGILALGLGDIVALDFMERIFAARTVVHWTKYRGWSTADPRQPTVRSKSWSIRESNVCWATSTNCPIPFLDISFWSRPATNRHWAPTPCLSAASANTASSRVSS